MAMFHRFKTEIAYYEANKKNWLKTMAGHIVVIRGKQVLGFFYGRADAVRECHRAFGDKPFLVREVLPEQPVVNLCGSSIFYGTSSPSNRARISRRTNRRTAPTRKNGHHRTAH
jgi:hypothetical protein